MIIHHKCNRCGKIIESDVKNFKNIRWFCKSCYEKRNSKFTCRRIKEKNIKEFFLRENKINPEKHGNLNIHLNPAETLMNAKRSI